MRIAAFSAVDLSLPQGHALHLRGLFDALSARKHEITLVTPRPTGVRPPVQFLTLETAILRWRVLGPWSYEIFGGLRLLLHCMLHRPALIYARQDLYTLAPALVAKLLLVELPDVRFIVDDEDSFAHGFTLPLLLKPSSALASLSRRALPLLTGIGADGEKETRGD